MIAIDLSKQQLRNADPKAIQQINFTGNLDLDQFLLNAELNILNKKLNKKT